MASHHHDADDDSDFDEYNPHPYQGGYDIALTYGRPLAPSPAICYPIAIESAHRPDPTPPPVPPSPAESRHLPEPEPEPYAPPPAYDYGGESGYRPVSHDWADLDVFGFWPFVSERWGRCADVEEVGYWSQWKRAGDYLFGYSEGFGERRIGVDSLGIPIYANKKGIGEAVSVKIEPARDLRVDRCESDSWFSSYDEKKDVSYGCAYNKYHYQEPLCVEENLNEPTLDQRLTYHEDYEEQEYPKLEWDSSMDNGVGYGSYTYGVPNNTNEWQHSEQPLSVQLEPFKSAWSQNPSLYEHSSMDNGVGYNNDTFEVPGNAYEWYYSEQPQPTQLEPFKPTWSQNPTFYEPYNSQSSWVDDSIKEYGAQFFSPFLEYSRYD